MRGTLWLSLLGWGDRVPLRAFYICACRTPLSSRRRHAGQSTWQIWKQHTLTGLSLSFCYYYYYFNTQWPHSVNFKSECSFPEVLNLFLALEEFGPIQSESYDFYECGLSFLHKYLHPE